MVDSLVRTGFKNLSLLFHHLVDAETRSPTKPDLPVLDQQGNFLELASTNLNKDFEHQCCEVGVGRFGASHLPRRVEDIGPHVFRIPGIPRGRFLPHQVWRIWFLVERVVGKSPPVALLADDMGLGKTFTTLSALLHLKWISSEATEGRRLACMDGRRVQDLGNDVPSFFGSAREVFQRPSVVMVPTPLVGQWAMAIRELSDGNRITLTNLNLNANRELGSDWLNYSSEYPKRGSALHLLSYNTYEAQCARDGRLAGCAWGVEIFDESHYVRSPRTLLYQALFNANVGGKFQLTGTPMYHHVNSWVVQADCLFSKIDPEACGTQGSPTLRELLVSVKTGGIEMNEGYLALKTSAYPWMNQRWAETKGSDG